jgi:hypothetical protein
VSRKAARSPHGRLSQIAIADHFDRHLLLEVNVPKGDLSGRIEFQRRFNSFTRFAGEANMVIRIFSIVSALVPVLGVATALGHPAAHAFAQFDQAGIIYQSTRLWPYDRANVTAVHAAYVGDGFDPSYLRDKEQQLDEPGYSSGGS